MNHGTASQIPKSNNLRQKFFNFLYLNLTSSCSSVQMARLWQFKIMHQMILFRIYRTIASPVALPLILGNHLSYG